MFEALKRIAARRQVRRRLGDDDLFLLGLHFANPGLLRPENVAVIEHALRNLPSDAPLVEVGSFAGLSTNVISYLRDRAGLEVELFSCDPWTFEHELHGPITPHTPITHEEYAAFVRESFLRNVSFFSDRLPHAIEATSDEFFELWRSEAAVEDVFGRRTRLGGPISFCFIDGNHAYEYARRDFENCDEFLVAGGFILFDDSGPDSRYDARRVAIEASQLDRYDVVVDEPNYLLRRR